MIMDVVTRVPVFEGDTIQEVQLIKSKLEEAGITAEVENSYLSFLSTPTATTMKVKVELKDEKKALEIVDEYLKSQQ
ncbi:DUF2007 domain-containing protein [Riemerella anatipestifer]|uniref:DUF2007 domain-containing protein n=3 Tax=Riemerella anatipestifer TaxID=34085 RepID=A0A1S7DUU7_RIEAN|nr:DUF2007 domain-containing protein [Riemerella anatipestifer]AFD55444.1 hypothetical protein RA0C_0465 [Riemerella anatipestifer ATCC 11845 = DSM 15868]AGC40674.1 hypothetical protein G148_1370 [Riemerella anatipestifer RA-CH-2]AKP68708.1 hypothetical protein CG08_0279 [Riemerella anatipestifer]AKP70554.1 hypothetical protein CG09_0268 [Riemerella anatipestifer]AKQ38987.1 hypothetical protein AS87_01255 [Riemerella anatipestifer Yb2]